MSKLNTYNSSCSLCFFFNFLTFKKLQNTTTALFFGFATSDFLLGGTQLS